MFGCKGLKTMLINSFVVEQIIQTLLSTCVAHTPEHISL